MKHFVFFILTCIVNATCSAAEQLPENFVHLKEIAPSIIQEMRYAGSHNFVGKPIRGYNANSCILTHPAAKALKQVQAQLSKHNYSLKVYDCYRPQMAVEEFYAWSQDPKNQTMKREFYPRINKKKLFKKEYIALYSGHSRGSTVDLTIVDLNNLQQSEFTQNTKLQPCYANYQTRFHDNSIDMGTGFDCLDKSANHGYKHISKQAKQNRLFLKSIMQENGFRPYRKEWWHYTLRDEPYKKDYFNFEVK